MTSAVKWTDVFPHQSAEVAVNFLCEIWREFASQSPLTFHSRRREPDLTELLCEQIRALCKQRTKLTGQWSYEKRFAKLNSEKEKATTVTSRKRTDIEYFSDREAVPLELVFEFKKLGATAARRKAYAGAEGLGRFVTGDYSHKQPVAVMVGILTDEFVNCVQPLMDLLNTENYRSSLNMPSAPAPCMRQPSDVFPASGNFDTCHTRSPELAPPSGAITVCHIFLPF